MVVVVVSKAMGQTVVVAVVVVGATIMRSLAAVTSTVVLVTWTFVRVQYRVWNCVRYCVRNRVQ